MPWFMIKLDGWRKWLLGFFREKNKISAMLSHFPFLHSCVLNWWMLWSLHCDLWIMTCFASRCIALKCDAVGLPLCILSYCGSDLFFSSQPSSAPVFSFRVVFRRILQHWNPHVHWNAHCTFGIQMYIFVLCLSTFFPSRFFKVFFACTQMGFSWSLHSVWPFNS